MQTLGESAPNHNSQKARRGMAAFAAGSIVGLLLTACGSTTEGTPVAAGSSSSTTYADKFSDSAIRQLAKDIFTAGDGQSGVLSVTARGATRDGDVISSTVSLGEQGDPATADDAEVGVFSQGFPGSGPPKVYLKFLQKDQGWHASCSDTLHSVEADSSQPNDWQKINDWAIAAQGIVQQGQASLHGQIQPSPQAPCPS